MPQDFALHSLHSPSLEFRALQSGAKTSDARHRPVPARTKTFLVDAIAFGIHASLDVLLRDRGEVVEEEGTMGKSVFRLWLMSYLVIAVSQLLHAHTVTDGAKGCRRAQEQP